MTWEYRARCIRVIDADTLELYVDCGFHTFRQEKFRLFGVDSPELRSKSEPERLLAVRAKDLVIELVNNGKEWPLLIRTHKNPDHFGRWLAEVLLEQDGGILASLGQILVAKGFAKPYTV